MLAISSCTCSIPHLPFEVISIYFDSLSAKSVHAELYAVQHSYTVHWLYELSPQWSC
uniref:Uncharacterized protein n=1 Tax=Arundo donax TaxID=35708 RepID=A0A0A9FLK6_ARUDO